VVAYLLSLVILGLKLIKILFL